MAVTSSLSALLNTLTQSLTAASDSAEKTPTLAPPKDGISLLNTKNELFLSYLQNLVFLILLKLRNRRSSSNTKDEEPLDNLVVKKLVELTVFLERGALNLEGKLKYQIDKVLRAAQDAENATKINGTMKSNGASRKKSAEDNGGSEESEDDSDQESTSDAGGVAMKASEINDLQYRPNPSALTRPSFAGAEEDSKTSEDGLYKPPRIQPTAMPTTERREKEARKPNKSATLDEYINTEMSAAPYAEPSIGSGIIDGGRRNKSEKQREEERARKEYEETNYVRLPKESKKERAKKGGRKDAGYGGEEWRGLGEGIDRIERLTKRKTGEGRSVLEKSRKRATEDGPRSSGGAEMGFAKRQKVQDIGRRDRGKR
jgi:U3 small nucleolar ribonucleoprotein protein LCP5